MSADEAMNNGGQVFVGADGLKEGCKFCAALAIVERIIGGTRHKWCDTAIDNGTITFIEHDGVHYGVTCQHVVQSLRERNANCGEGSYVVATLKDGVYALSDQFAQPLEGLGNNRRPDVMLTRLPHDFPKKIGKRFFSLRAASPPDPIPFAVGFGFPSGEKTILSDLLGSRMGMPCAQATAEGLGSGKQFLSILDDAPEIKHLSGMSGGPVFWSTADQYGLLGFMYEGSPTGRADDTIQSPRVHFHVAPCDHQEFSRWVEELRLGSSTQPAAIYPLGAV